jgi:uncharacterized protein (DUF488 family)
LTRTGSIFTVGYEGASLVSLIEVLKLSGVEVLLDVRRDPWSRRPEFKKRALERVITAAGIAYRHEPRLGVPKEVRERFRGGADAAGFNAWYLGEVLATQPALLDELAELVRSAPTALLCYEADHRRCHRGLLALELSRLTGLPVEHLKPRELGTHRRA